MQTPASEAEALLASIVNVLPYSNGHAAGVLRRALRELVTDDAGEKRKPSEITHEDPVPAQKRNPSVSSQPEVPRSTRSPPAVKRSRPGSKLREDARWPATAARIAARMRSGNVTMPVLAKLLGVSESSLGRYLSRDPNRNRVPHPDVRTRLAEWLDAQPEHEKGLHTMETLGGAQHAAVRQIADGNLRKPSETCHPATMQHEDPLPDDWATMREAINARAKERRISRGTIAFEVGWSEASLAHALAPAGKPPSSAIIIRLRTWLGGTSMTPAPEVAVSAPFRPAGNGVAAA
jgi:predicted transcriptional regulator